MEKKLAVIVLAAGKGKRLGGRSQKTAKKLLGKPMLIYLLDTLETLSPEKIVVVVGHKKEEVFKQLSGRRVEYAEQQVPRGTGDAVMKASGILNNYKGNILVLCGDVPFITTGTIKKLMQSHKTCRNCGTILTVRFDNPTGYGRIKRNGEGTVKAIIEELNATDEEKKIREINSGIYIFNKKDLFEALLKVKPDAIKGEYYLTDVVKILSAAGKKIDTYTTEHSEECMGINTNEDFKRAEEFLRRPRQ